MVSTFLSRIIGLVRVKYILWLFGRGVTADALNGAFVLPDMISYFLVGGAGSIAFVTILTGYRDSGREAQGERSLSVILSTMYIVLGAAILLWHSCRAVVELGPRARPMPLGPDSIAVERYDCAAPAGA